MTLAGCAGPTRLARCAAALTLVVAAADASVITSSDTALLVVDGAVTPPPALAGGADRAGEAHLDLRTLAALPRVTVRTRDPWSSGVQTFSGARLSDVLDAAGASGYRVVAEGLDDYRAELDPDEVARYPIIVAWLDEGAPMTVRTLGPLRIVMPFDDHPELDNAVGRTRAVRQLVRLTVLD